MKRAFLSVCFGIVTAVAWLLLDHLVYLPLAGSLPGYGVHSVGIGAAIGFWSGGRGQ